METGCYLIFKQKDLLDRKFGGEKAETKRLVDKKL